MKNSLAIYFSQLIYSELFDYLLSDVLKGISLPLSGCDGGWDFDKFKPTYFEVKQHSITAKHNGNTFVSVDGSYKKMPSWSISPSRFTMRSRYSILKAGLEVKLNLGGFCEEPRRAQLEAVNGA